MREDCILATDEYINAVTIYRGFTYDGYSTVYGLRVSTTTKVCDLGQETTDMLHVSGHQLLHVGGCAGLYILRQVTLFFDGDCTSIDELGAI